MMNELIYYFSIVLADLSGLIIAINLFNGLFYKKDDRRNYNYAVLVVVFLCLVSSHFLLNETGGFVISSTVLYIICIMTVYEGNAPSRLLVAIFYTVFGIISEVMTAVIIIASLGISIDALVSDRYIFLAGTVLSKLILFGIVKAMIRVSSKEKYHFSMRNSLLVLTIPVVSIGICLYVFDVQLRTQMPGEGSILVALCILYLNIVAFSMFDIIGMTSKEVKAYEERERHLKYTQSAYKQNMKYYEEIMKFKHDFRNHLIVLGSHISCGDSTKALEYLKGIGEVESGFGSSYLSGNLPIDAIFHSKIMDATEHQIKIEHDVTIKREMPIDDMDISVILGNGFDNAIEACRKIEEVERRIIDVIIKYRNEHLIIRIKNPLYAVTDDNRNGIFKSTKQGNHGHGLSNMKAVVDKCGGNMDIDLANENFILDITIPCLVKTS